MRTKTQAVALLSLAAPMLATQAQTAQTGAATPPPATPPSGIEQTIKEIKNPVPWFNWGTDLRLRNEYFNNILSLTPSSPLHEQDYFRLRARLWASITPVEDFSFNARLATEPRLWMRPAGYTPYRGRSGFDATEGIIDNLNVQWRNILDQPATLTVGRQDILLGDGWLTGEGTPYDGSWTYYLDAARLTYELKDQHTTIDAIGIIQNAKEDAWLPVINFQNRYENEQNEKGAILSVVNSTFPAVNLNPYFIYKHDNKLNSYSPSIPAPAGGDNGDIYTIGARVFGTPFEHWKYSLEGAYQFGEKQDTFIKFPAVSQEFRDLNAFGANAKVTYLVKDKLNNQLSLAAEILSADDPDTTDDEMFDNLWGRYPRWSEVGLYSFAAETRIGQEANLVRFGPGWSMNPIKNMDLILNYNALFAIEEVPTRQASPTLFSRDGNFRGHFAQAVLKYKFNQHFSGHLWGEMVFPGDYYARHDMWTFLRAEVMLTF